LYYLIINNLFFAVENHVWGIRQLASNKNKKGCKIDIHCHSNNWTFSTFHNKKETFMCV